VVVREEGFIVTNYHVVRGAQAIEVSFSDDPNRYPAKLVSYVQAEDLALLQIDQSLPPTVRKDRVPTADLEGLRPASLRAFPTVKLGTSSDLWPGERVVAIGNPHGQEHTVSTGIISGLHRNVPIQEEGLNFSDLIQTDASINFGNSGGPLLNIRGELIGINTAMNQQAENIGFAIPVDRVLEVLHDVLFPQARMSWMGFDLKGGDSLTVDRVWGGGPAAGAGICEGDRIVAIGERQIGNEDDYLLATLEVPPNQPVTVRYARGSRTLEASFEPWDKFDGTLWERLGLTVREATFRRDQWLLVDKIREGGPAEQTGLRFGDLIPVVEAQRPGVPSVARVVQDRRSLAQIVQELEVGTSLGLDVYRDEDGDRAFEPEERYTGTLVIR
jgi:serine protease Do